jgi:hypothetical protein
MPLLLLLALALAVDTKVVEKTTDATPWRGKTISFTASVRGEGARLWIRVVRPNRTPGLLENLTSEPVRGSEWQQLEISIPVAKDAEKVEYGILTSGSEQVEYRDPSVDAPGATKRVETRESFERTFSAEPWRGGALHLKAMVKLENPAAVARLWMRTEQHYWYKTVSDTNWVQAELTQAIEDEAENITIGVSLVSGEGRIEVDGVTLQSAPVAAAAPDKGLAATPLPPEIDLQKTIDNAAHKAGAYIAGLPNFMCTELVRRFENRGAGGWRNRDVLGIQLTYSEQAENYKLVTLNNQPTSALFGDMMGAVTQGDFGSIMNEIFTPGSARFLWQRQDVLRGHPVYVFSYRVTAEKSKYHIQFGTSRASSYGIDAAHHGTVTLDRDTGDVLQLVQIADTPEWFPVRQASTTVDYDFIDISGKRFLLPIKAESVMGTESILTRNEVEYRDYRKFTADSNISFTESKP